MLGDLSRFESVAQLVEHRTFNPMVVGSIPTRFTNNGPLAQLVEPPAHNRLVLGSSPRRPILIMHP